MEFLHLVQDSGNMIFLRKSDIVSVTPIRRRSGVSNMKTVWQVTMANGTDYLIAQFPIIPFLFGPNWRHETSQEYLMLAKEYG